MGRQITMYCTGRNVQRFDVPLASIGDTLRSVAKLAKDRPPAVDVFVNDMIVAPSDENRNRVPPPCDTIVLVQNCTAGRFKIPNETCLLE